MSLHTKPHIRRVHVCQFSCNLPPALLAERPDLLHATAITRGWNRYCRRSQHRKLTLEKKILPPLLFWQSNPRPSDHKSSTPPLSYPRRYFKVILVLILTSLNIGSHHDELHIQMFSSVFTICISCTVNCS